MKLATVTASALLVVLSPPEIVAKVGLRGGNPFSVVGETSNRELSSTYYDNLRFCGHIYAASENDKYFWLTLLKDKDSGVDIKGSCLLTVPSGTSKDTEVCCTATNTDGGSSVQYSTDYSLSVSDPHTVTDTNSTAYQTCGKNGGTSCTDYNYDTNQQGFTYFKIEQQDGDGLRKMSKFVGGGNSNCGLTHKAGTCASGEEDIYEHVHIGVDYCLEGVVTLAHHCDGHSGYTCLNVDCY